MLDMKREWKRAFDGKCSGVSYKQWLRKWAKDYSEPRYLNSEYAIAAHDLLERK